MQIFFNWSFYLFWKLVFCMFYESLSMKEMLNNHKIKIEGSYKGNITFCILSCFNWEKGCALCSLKIHQDPLVFYYLLPRGGDYFFLPLRWHFQNNSCSIITSSGRRKECNLWYPRDYHVAYLPFRFNKDIVFKPKPRARSPKAKIACSGFSLT